MTKEIITRMLGATLVLLVLFVTNQSVQFLDRAASGTLPATEVLQVIALQLPLLLGFLLPLGLYFGILLTFSRLYIDSEMTVLSACGVSRAKLTGMIFVIAVCVASVVTWLMTSVVPSAQGEINVILSDAMASASVAEVIPGRFMVFGKKTQKPITFYAQKVTDHSILHNVFMATKSDSGKNSPEKWEVIVAKTAFEAKKAGGRYLVFDQGYRNESVPGQKESRIMEFQEYGVRLFANTPAHPNDVQYYSLSKLYHSYATSLDAAAELQWRLAMPISAIAFALLAIPLSEVKPRYGKFTQLLPAILIYVTYADLIFLTRSWISSGRLSPALGMWWVHGAVFLLAFILMLYRFGWRRLCRPFLRKQ